jgi:hypothetical protein
MLYSVLSLLVDARSRGKEREKRELPAPIVKVPYHKSAGPSSFVARMQTRGGEARSRATGHFLLPCPS